MTTKTLKWHDSANCKGMETNIFFTESTNKQYKKNTALARAVCNKCKVRSECLNYALTENVPFGIWGGLSPRERSAVIRKYKLENYSTVIPNIINKTKEKI